MAPPSVVAVLLSKLHPVILESEEIDATPGGYHSLSRYRFFLINKLILG